MDNEKNKYIISGGQEGKDRLNLLSEVMHPYTHALLQAQGLTTGMLFLDTGCGGGNVSRMAAQMVGMGGSVTAVDFDTTMINLNKQEATKTSTSNIAYYVASVYDIDYDSIFDMAYARFLLSHLTNPLHALQNILRAVKPGGKVIVEDIHFSGHFCHPPSSAFRKYIDYFTIAAANNGHNAEIGPELFHLFQQAGFNNIDFDVIQPAFNTGRGKWMAHITLDRIKHTLTTRQIATHQAIDNILHELEAFTRDDNTIISLPRIFRVWGQKAR